MWFGLVVVAADVRAERGPAVTQHDVQAILLRHCTVCHGRHHQEGGLSLLDRDSLLKGGKSGPAIILKKGTLAEQSAALRAARARLDTAEKLLQGRIPELVSRLKKQFPTGKPEPASSGLIAHFPLDGPAAQLVDPHDPDSIAHGLLRVMNDDAHRQDLIERGLAHARTFTWRRCAEQILHAYRRTLDDHASR